MMNARSHTQAAATSVDELSRPSLVLLGTEPWRAAAEFLSHKLTRRSTVSDGDGHPVVIFPGLGSGSSAVAPLSQHCESLGYTALDWGRGFNRGPQGDVHAWLADLAKDIAALLADHKQSATLIGWSLGGLYAREVAKLLGSSVRQVITIGTPFNAESDYTNVGWLYRLLSGAPAKLDDTLSRRLRKAPKVPTVSIYSRTDGVVAWQTCRHAEEDSHHTQDVEIRGSHIGMGWNPAVLRVVADRLAQRPGHWRPYSANDMHIH